MSSHNNLRRSSRIKSAVKYTEEDETETHSNASTNILRTELETELNNIKEDVQRPIELFSERDVSGRELYRFQTPTKKNSMMIKANQCSTPETPKSFKTFPALRVVLEKIKISQDRGSNSINKSVDIEDLSVTRKQLLHNLNSDDEESVSEDSEYVPGSKEVTSESDGTSDEGTNEDSDVSEEEVNVQRKVKQNMPQKSLLKQDIQDIPKQIGTKYKTIITYKDFHMKTDEYFESQREKAITSDHTLSRLKNSHLTEERLKELLTNQSHISTIHNKRLHSLIENYKSFFSMWQFIMEEGYSLLLHGLGSKRDLINEFHNVIMDHPSLIINGFFPSLSIKDILNGIIVDLLDLDCPTNPNDCLELIEKTLKANTDDRLYLIIHNIDGIMLRSNKAQNILAHLATIPNIHILASVDHINAPLLWDHIKRAKFNFYWWDATTFLPYQAETSYESSLLVQQSGTLALSSLQNVFLSLTSNARAVYIILVKYQTNNTDNNFSGMPFKDLYRAAREQFLVSSDLALRAQLTEFIDHKLVRTKRNVDGAEHLTIPLNNDLLKQFLEQYQS